MKKLALLLALMLLLTACNQVPPPADTAPPQTTEPVVETTAPVETIPEPTTPPVITDLTPYEALISYDAHPNWLARSLSCLYESPTEIDLNYMFYLGVEHPGSWDAISTESRDFLVEQGFMEEFDLQIMPVEKMDAILRDTFGIELKDVAMPTEWRYIEAEDAYCSNHSDAYFPGVPNITAVEDDSQTIVIHYTIDGYWIPDTGEFLDTAPLVLSLVRNEDGTIHAVSNLLES